MNPGIRLTDVLPTLTSSSEQESDTSSIFVEEPNSGGVLITAPLVPEDESPESEPDPEEFPYFGLEYSQGIYRFEHNPSNTAVILSTQPMDPNEIIGLEGYNAPESVDTFRWVAATQSLAYTIYFENDPELAMAAASKVAITLPLHEKLNHATFGVGSFGFGSHVIAVEGSPSSYQTRIDLRDSMGIYLDVVAGLDIVNHEAFWIFQSIDPATGLPPTDINLGFLPINDSLHSGEGFVTFTIKPNSSVCVTGDTITATASIVFDVNEAIATNTWLNTVDAYPPTSGMSTTVNATGDMLTATFLGNDDEGGCGIKQFKLYHSVNSSAYQLYEVYPVGDTAEIPLETGMEYRFFVLAEDNVGNCEPMKTQPEYTIGTNFVTVAVNAFPQEAGTVTGGGSYSVNDTAVLAATAADGYHFVNWMCQGVPLSSQNPYAVEVTQNQTFTAFFERDAYMLQTLAAAGSTITVTDLNGNEVPSGSTVFHADKLIVSVDTADCYSMESVLMNGASYLPGDTLTVEGDLVLSTTTESMFAQTDTTAIVCESFTWYGITYMQSGDYTKTLTAVDGCDSVVTLHLTVNHAVYTDDYLSICESDLPYTYGDTVFEVGTPASSIFQYSLSTVAGCDSIVTLHLTVGQSTYRDITAVACGSFIWHDSTYTSSGTYVSYQTNVAGCDSIETLHLTINQSTTADTTVVVCDSFTWNGTTYTESGDYSRTITNATGCNSVVTLHLTVHHSVTESVEATACDTYTWNDSTYTQSGDYTKTFTAANGCDSIETLHLTVNYSNTGDTAAVACDSYDWYGTTYTLSGDYTHTLTNASGCDSVVTLHLTVNYSNIGDTTAVACDSFDWYGTTYTASGDYSHTLTNAVGCDSVVTLHLTVNYSNIGDTTAVACDSFDWYGTTYTSSGDYTHTLTNASGCDSVVTLHLTVNYSNTDDTAVVVCDSFDWYGATYTSSGDYTHTLTNASGCDSVVTLHLTVNYSNTGDTAAVVCDSFDWYETTYTSSGDYSYTLTNASGCDSVVTLHLTVNYSNTGDTAAVVCDSFDWYGTTYTTSGDYTYTLTNASGCDSVVTLHLTVNYSNTGDTAAVVCDSLDWYGTTYTTSGDYTYTLTNASGCDSVVTLHLTVNYSNTGDTAAVACDNYDWYGATYTASGDYTHTLTNASGCDSVVTLHLTVNYSNTGDTDAIACDSYAWNDSVYTQSGDYVQTFTNVDGCDSIVTLHLTVNHSVTTEYAETACDSYTWNDSVYTQSGDYVQTFTNAVGCDSVVTLHLTLNHSETTEYTETACDSYMWNDSVYTQSGDYAYTLTNASGCDSVVTLHLTVNTSATSEDYLTICESELPYTYGDTVFEVGTPELSIIHYTLSTVNGCDSIVTFYLTVEPTDSTEFAVTTDSCYIWNGLAYCASGDYTQIIQGAYGCDSVVTLHLTVTVGIDGYNGFDIVLYPNPAREVVNVQCTMYNVQEVEVFDVFGKLVTTTNVIDNPTQINVSSLANGMYFVRVTTDRGTVTKPFVKQ